ncbi:hypothetical protein NGRA_2263 [Nosema granulosis]|uniref:Reverse transcriptase n=1 Tax=Nosema granulosis TaxID=83296 RepID=A0A9P6KYB7_9MICR|nr:hypothetical protein NGRA_2263 [Nosema granulosis]
MAKIWEHPRQKREGALCFLQDRNVLLGETKRCPHCGEASKTVGHLASKCEKMLGTDYTRRHNEVLKCIHLLMCFKYGIKSTKKLRIHSMQQIVSNKYVKIRVDMFVKTDIKIKHNRPDLIVIDKLKKEILIVEVGITSGDNLQQVETEKLRKYDLIASELSQIYGFKPSIIPYVLTWDGVVTKYHEIYRRRLETSDRIEVYIQSLVLKKDAGKHISCAKRDLLVLNLIWRNTSWEPLWKYLMHRLEQFAS